VSVLIFAGFSSPIFLRPEFDIPILWQPSSRSNAASSFFVYHVDESLRALPAKTRDSFAEYCPWNRSYESARNSRGRKLLSADLRSRGPAFQAVSRGFLEIVFPATLDTTSPLALVQFSPSVLPPFAGSSSLMSANSFKKAESRYRACSFSSESIEIAVVPTN
jgi:hypothetical protein